MTNEPDLTLRPRTRRVFTQDDMKRMAALYYDTSVPMHRVGAAFGVPTSTFLRWIAEMEWPRRSARGAAGQADGQTAGTLDAPAGNGPSAGDQSGRRLMTLDEKERERLNEPVDPALAPYYARRRTPNLLATLKQASELARRELDAAAKMDPETMADRERVAALVDRLSRALDRITKSLGQEQRNENWRRAMRKVE